MCARSLFFICGLAIIIQAFGQPAVVENVASKPTDTVRTSTKQTQSKTRNSTPKAVDAVTSAQETVQTTQSNDLQSLTNIHIESAADVDALIDEIEKAADEIYNSEMSNIQTWSGDRTLAQFKSQAEEGLTIARDRLKESAQKLRTKATEAIENARATMSPEEFSKYMQELQQVIEIELAPTRQYFMDAAEAITQVSKETAAKTASKASRGSKSQKKNSNVPSTTSIPVSTKA